MRLLDVSINGIKHYALWDPVANDILDFGAGLHGLRLATEFLNTLFLAEHAAFCAGFAH